ncbi:hypothetical protein D3C87_704040 [compost metagenome]
MRPLIPTPLLAGTLLALGMLLPAPSAWAHVPDRVEHQTTVTPGKNGAQSGHWLDVSESVFRWEAPSPASASLEPEAPPAASVPDLGPDWELAGSRKVRSWVPHPALSGGGTWQLVDFNKYRLFQESLVNPAPDMPASPAPDVLLGPIKKGRPYEESKGIERVRKGLAVHKYQTLVTVTPQTRTETTVRKSWTLSEFTRTENRSRALRTKYGLYDLSFQVPVLNYRWDVVELGRSSREATLEPSRTSRVVELLPPERASEVSALAAAGGDRPGVFRGDAGSGGKASLSGSKLREQMGANHVKASDALTPEQLEAAKKHAEEETRKQFEAEMQAKAEAEETRKKAASDAAEAARKSDSAPAITAVLGQWVSGGGKSQITVARNGNSNNLRVHAHLVLNHDTLSKTVESLPFGPSFQMAVGKDKFGVTYTMKATVNAEATQMRILIWRDGLINAIVAEGTLTKKSGAQP